MAFTRDSILQLTAWLAVNEPEMFLELQRRSTPRTTLGSYRAFAGIYGRPVHGRAMHGRAMLGHFGQTTSDAATFDYSTLIGEGDSSDEDVADSSNFDFSTINPDSTNYMPADTSPLDVTGFDTSVNDLTDLSSSVSPLDVGTASDVISSVDLTAPAAAQPSVASNILSGVASAAGAVGSAALGVVSGVASWVGSPQGMQTLGAVATSYFNAQAQTAALQTQLSRASQGLSPAPIGYMYNAAGQLVPIVTGANGQPLLNANGEPYAVTPSALASVTPGGILPASLSAYLPYLLIGGAVLLALMLTKPHHSETQAAPAGAS